MRQVTTHVSILCCKQPLSPLLNILTPLPSIIRKAVWQSTKQIQYAVASDPYLPSSSTPSLHHPKSSVAGHQAHFNTLWQTTLISPPLHPHSLALHFLKSRV
jgi:hypothetical protein